MQHNNRMRRYHQSHTHTHNHQHMHQHRRPNDGKRNEPYHNENYILHRYRPYYEAPVAFKGHIFISKHTTRQLAHIAKEEQWGPSCNALYKFLDYSWRVAVVQGRVHAFDCTPKQKYQGDIVENSLTHSYYHNNHIDTHSNRISCLCNDTSTSNHNHNRNQSNHNHNQSHRCPLHNIVANSSEYISEWAEQYNSSQFRKNKSRELPSMLGSALNPDPYRFNRGCKEVHTSRVFSVALMEEHNPHHRLYKPTGTQMIPNVTESNLCQLVNAEGKVKRLELINEEEYIAQYNQIDKSMSLAKRFPLPPSSQSSSPLLSNPYNRGIAVSTTTTMMSPPPVSSSSQSSMNGNGNGNNSNVNYHGRTHTVMVFNSGLRSRFGDSWIYILIHANDVSPAGVNERWRVAYGNPDRRSNPAFVTDEWLRRNVKGCHFTETLPQPFRYPWVRKMQLQHAMGHRSDSIHSKHCLYYPQHSLQPLTTALLKSQHPLMPSPTTTYSDSSSSSESSDNELFSAAVMIGDKTGSFNSINTLTSQTSAGSINTPKQSTMNYAAAVKSKSSHINDDNATTIPMIHPSSSFVLDDYHPTSTTTAAAMMSSSQQLHQSSSSHVQGYIGSNNVMMDYKFDDYYVKIEVPNKEPVADMDRLKEMVEDYCKMNGIPCHSKKELHFDCEHVNRLLSREVNRLRGTSKKVSQLLTPMIFVKNDQTGYEIEFLYPVTIEFEFRVGGGNNNHHNRGRYHRYHHNHNHHNSNMQICKCELTAAGAFHVKQWEEWKYESKMRTRRPRVVLELKGYLSANMAYGNARLVGKVTMPWLTRFQPGFNDIEAVRVENRLRVFHYADADDDEELAKILLEETFSKYGNILSIARLAHCSPSPGSPAYSSVLGLGMEILFTRPDSVAMAMKEYLDSGGDSQSGYLLDFIERREWLSFNWECEKREQYRLRNQRRAEPPPPRQQYRKRITTSNTDNRDRTGYITTDVVASVVIDPYNKSGVSSHMIGTQKLSAVAAERVKRSNLRIFGYGSPVGLIDRIDISDKLAKRTQPLSLSPPQNKNESEDESKETPTTSINTTPIPLSSSPPPPQHTKYDPIPKSKDHDENPTEKPLLYQNIHESDHNQLCTAFAQLLQPNVDPKCIQPFITISEYNRKPTIIPQTKPSLKQVRAYLVADHSRGQQIAHENIFIPTADKISTDMTEEETKECSSPSPPLMWTLSNQTKSSIEEAKERNRWDATSSVSSSGGGGGGQNTPSKIRVFTAPPEPPSRIATFCKIPTAYHQSDCDIFDVELLLTEDELICFNRDGTIDMRDETRIQPKYWIRIPSFWYIEQQNRLNNDASDNIETKKMDTPDSK